MYLYLLATAVLCVSCSHNDTIVKDLYATSLKIDMEGGTRNLSEQLHHLLTEISS